MEAVVTALTALIAEQGKQIVDLSKALAIAHEHHAQPPMVAVPPTPPFQGKLWLSEDEEDEAFAAGELIPAQETESALSEILAAAGLDPNVTVA